VDGTFANEETYFPFSATVTAPSTIPAGTTSYKAYVVDGEGDLVGEDEIENVSTAAVEDEEHGGYYLEFTSGVANALNLKAGQQLVFVGLPVGSGWTVTDMLGTGLEDYVAAAAYTASDGGSANETGTKGAALTVPVSGSLWIATDGSTAAFTNTREVVSPTGILLNTLPYVGLILLALAGLALFIVVKSRRREDETYES
jgi:hypothetical protein